VLAKAIDMAEKRSGPLPQSETRPLRTGISAGAPVDAPAEMSPGFTSQQLLGRANAVVICHEGERYTLRRTSKGKLILTK
jgi:hemin uptake protein HemP